MDELIGRPVPLKGAANSNELSLVALLGPSSDSTCTVVAFGARTYKKLDEWNEPGNWALGMCSLFVADGSDFTVDRSRHILLLILL